MLPQLERSYTASAVEGYVWGFAAERDIINIMRKNEYYNNDHRRFSKSTRMTVSSRNVKRLIMKKNSSLRILIPSICPCNPCLPVLNPTPFAIITFKCSLLVALSIEPSN